MTVLVWLCSPSGRFSLGIGGVAPVGGLLLALRWGLGSWLIGRHRGLVCWAVGGSMMRRMLPLDGVLVWGAWCVVEWLVINQSAVVRKKKKKKGRLALRRGHG